MITSIKTHLKNDNESMTTFPIANVNIFVGPNSSGKSLLLKELNYYLSANNYSFQTNSSLKIIEEINFEPVSIDNQISYINSFGNSLEKVDYHERNYNRVKLNTEYENVSSIFNALNANQNNRSRVDYFDKFFTLYLNGASRLNLLNSLDFSPYEPINETYFSTLYHDPDLYSEFKEYIKDAFGLHTYFKVNGSQIGFVFSRTPAPQDFDEFSLKLETIEFLKLCLTNDDLSDGQRSYIGILLQLLAGNPEIIIIDEVEAFLHPPLARKLGSLISKIANDKNKQVFLSTHSPNTILGAIQSGAKTNIIRLRYDGSIGESTIIDSEHLENIMSHPLIRSTNFLDALFYKNAVVTESDSDRAFYQEINFRLSKFKPEYSINDCLFLNAQNKQTVGTIVKELRKIGVPTASIIDLDFIKDGGPVFTEYLSSVNIPSSLHQTIQTNKTTMKTIYQKFNDDFKTLKEHGVSALSEGEAASANHLLHSLEQYGQFPVPVGELECWLPNVESYNHGSKWLIKKFENLGFDESSTNYVKPEDNDVWEFIYRIKQWLENPQKLGMISSN